MDRLIKQIIIVEGKTDTQKLQKIFGAQVKTIETQGLRLDRKFLVGLNQLNHHPGLIIFTDPDFAGQKIRDRLNNYLEHPALNAFLNQKDMRVGAKKIGLAEATDAAVEEALEKVALFDTQTENSISWESYVQNQLHLKSVRLQIAQKLHWPATLNGKTLFKWLNWSGLTITDVRKILEDSDAG